MKFGQTLATRLTPEWRKQYINYFQLKEMILNAMEKLPPDTNTDEYDEFIEKFDESFFRVCENELYKVDTFFAEKLAEARRKFREFYAEVELLAIEEKKSRLSHFDLNVVISTRKMKQLKLAVSEYYLSLMLLKNFQTLNCTGFRKILKKHDKKLHLRNGAKWYTFEVERSDFARNAEVEELIKKTEAMFTNNLAGGDRARAMKHLRVPPFEELQSSWRIFRLGFALGLFTCLFCLIFILASSSELSKFDCIACIQLHRGPFLFILLIFLIGINVYGWRKAGVNHILIFEIDPRDHLTATHVLEIAAYFGVLWALSFIGCLQRTFTAIPPKTYPFILVLLMILYWLAPIPIIHWRSRLWLMKVVGRIVSAPFFTVQFADFWLADQINSMSSALIDYQFIACVFTSKNWFTAPDPYSCLNEIGYLTSAIIVFLPAWWRFAQSLRRFYDTRLYFPFLANAGKYASSFPVAGLSAALHKNKEKYKDVADNPYFWPFVGSRLFSTIYSYLWDIFMDFGLLKKFSGENIFLRDEIIYAQAFYYFGIIENFILRFLWVGAIIIEKYKLIENIYLSTFLAIAEVVRRYLWNYFRLEHEHVNNAGKFRAVRDISFKLVEADDQKRLESMMDRREGVYNRSKYQRDSDENDD